MRVLADVQGDESFGQCGGKKEEEEREIWLPKQAERRLKEEVGCPSSPLVRKFASFFYRGGMRFDPTLFRKRKGSKKTPTFRKKKKGRVCWPGKKEKSKI